MTYTAEEVDSMRESLDRAQKARFLWASLNKEMAQRRQPRLCPH